MTTWIGAHPNNFQAGRAGNTVNKIVCHWIVGKLSAADATFQDPARVASAHYGVGNNEVHGYVKEEDTAYHAGNLTVNRQSIGIEHEGGPSIPISEETYQTSGKLIREIAKRYNIPLDRAHIIKHSEVPRATACPGTLDLDKLITIAGGSMSEIDDLKKQVADLQKEVADKNVQIGNYAQQVTGLQQFAKDEYQRGFKDGQATAPSTGVDPSKWEQNGLTIEQTVGGVKTISNYKRKV